MFLLMCTQKSGPVQTPVKNNLPPLFREFSGRWKYVNGADSGYEVWRLVNDTLLQGFSIRFNDPDTTETLTIVKKEGHWHYCPRFPLNEEHKIDFKLERLNDSGALFVNLKNDFPDSISYRYRNKDHLQIVLSGSAGRTYKLDMKRQLP